MRILFLITLLVLSASASAVAAETCNLGSLQGRFVFTGRGFIEKVQPDIQRVHYGMFVFDGAGKFTGKQSSSRGGKIGRETIEGVYTLDTDCTGTMTFGGIMDPTRNVHWDLFVAEDRKRGHMIRMDEGNMAIRSFEK